jgi:hypothetical protein
LIPFGAKKACYCLFPSDLILIDNDEIIEILDQAKASALHEATIAEYSSRFEMPYVESDSTKTRWEIPTHSCHSRRM